HPTDLDPATPNAPYALCFCPRLAVARVSQPTRTTPQPFTLDDHSKVVPRLPIPNRTVKRLCADDSGRTSVKVGHRQALTPQNPICKYADGVLSLGKRIGAENMRLKPSGGAVTTPARIVELSRGVAQARSYSKGLRPSPGEIPPRSFLGSKSPLPRAMIPSVGVLAVDFAISTMRSLPCSKASSSALPLPSFASKACNSASPEISYCRRSAPSPKKKRIYPFSYLASVCFAKSPMGALLRCMKRRESNVAGCDAPANVSCCNGRAVHARSAT